jgi:very-short-patch-repair endonuclease
MGNIRNHIDVNERRKELRRRQTCAEKVLWLSLRNCQLEGRKFRRQESIGKYIVDFYCPSERLIIELDGADHFTEEGIIYDEKRSEYLSNLKFRIIRFENEDVIYNLDAVIKKIKECFFY